jgi:hypothetical protein
MAPIVAALGLVKRFGSVTVLNGHRRNGQGTKPTLAPAKWPSVARQACPGRSGEEDKQGG